MFIIDSIYKFISAFDFFFSSFIFIALSIVTSIGRVSQVLFKNKFNKPTYIILEILVELLRVLQYLLFIVIGSGVSLNTTSLFQNISNGLSEVTSPKIIWDLIGFIVIFGLYNIVIFSVFNKFLIQRIIERVHIQQHSAKTIRLAIILGYKNLFLIPISVIYLFIILNFI
ncbi:hypothetical protein [Lysinibacillus sp. NPDC056232]|uniref:hypothetical protein n=1 Tax=Lysinibacillus sp. NPDC056232 TaxID=3345756 RepID=UPI0035DD6EDE